MDYQGASSSLHRCSTSLPPRDIVVHRRLLETPDGIPETPENLQAVEDVRITGLFMSSAALFMITLHNKGVLTGGRIEWNRGCSASCSLPARNLGLLTYACHARPEHPHHCPDDTRC
eukprot:3444692-Amphidinium_carterae.2